MSRSSRQTNYHCTQCGMTPQGTMTEQRDELTVMRVVFTEMGEGQRTVRSRVVAWLCTSCLGRNMFYHLPERRGQGAPEMLDRSLDAES